MKSGLLTVAPAVISAVGAFLSLPSSSQWTEVNYDTSAPHLWDVMFTDDTTGYAAGVNFIMKTEDGGLTWRTINLPEVAEDERRSNIWFWPTGDGIMARNDLGIWASEDEGETWKSQNREIKGISRRLYKHKYLTQSELWESTNSGRSWYKITSLELPENRTTSRRSGEGIACCYNNSFRDFYWINDKFGIVVGGFSYDLKGSVLSSYAGLVYITYDRGQSWTQDLEGMLWNGPYTLLGIFGFQDFIWMLGLEENIWSGYPGAWKKEEPIWGFIPYSGLISGLLQTPLFYTSFRCATILSCVHPIVAWSTTQVMVLLSVSRDTARQASPMVVSTV